MFLTTGARYAVMAVISLASNLQNSKPVPIKTIAAEQGLSLYYLERIFAKLAKAGIVKSVKGPGGGYIFCKKPEEITLREILQAVGENVEITKCGIENLSSCSNAGFSKCNSHNLWANLSSYIQQYLRSTTLQDIKEKRFFFK